MKRGIYAGYFDPITLGHLDVIRRASRILDELHIMIGFNPNKNYRLFPIDRRIYLIERYLKYMNWLGRDR